MDKVQANILASMLRGELVPGTWIRQDDLAASLGVSKIPVREALQRLVARGLLKAERNRGVLVPRLSAEEAEEIFELRAAVELKLLGRAVARMNRIDMASAEEALAAKDLTLTEANWAFHRALYRASGWKRGLALDEVLHAAVAPYVLLYIDDLGGAPRSDQQHVEILRACRDGDGEGAHDLLKQHLVEAASALTEYLS